MKLKKDVGKVEVKALGLILTPESTEEEIKEAIKHQPSIARFVDGATTEKPKK